MFQLVVLSNHECRLLAEAVEELLIVSLLKL